MYIILSNNLCTLYQKHENITKCIVHVVDLEEEEGGIRPHFRLTIYRKNKTFIFTFSFKSDTACFSRMIINIS